MRDVDERAPKEGPANRHLCWQLGRATGLILLAALAVVQVKPTTAHAHPAGLDQNGCHHDHKRGDYYCHGAPRSEQHSAQPRRTPEPMRLQAIPSTQHPGPVETRAPVRTPTATRARVLGQATIVDGDTIEVHGLRIRIWGIDAPESNQICTRDGRPWRCGQQSALALADHIGRRTVSCVEEDRDRYGRIVARCSIAGSNLAEWLVRNGWALDWAEYSNGEFANIQELAAAEKVGIWQGSFETPWQWRRDQARQ